MRELIEEVLEKNAGKDVKVFSEHSGETHKGTLCKTCRNGWKLRFKVNGSTQVLYFPLHVVGIVKQNPLLLRLKNKKK